MYLNIRPRQTGSAVRTWLGRTLRGRYDDHTATEMGQQDSPVAAGGDRWGANHVLWGLWTILETAVIQTCGVRIHLEGRLISLRSRYEKARARFSGAHKRASSAITGVEQVIAERRVLHQDMADHGQQRPGPRWPAAIFLAVLVLGDLALTSNAVAVLGISDRPFVSWLPFSGLQVAAAPIVIGLVAAAHVLGGAIREHRDADQRLRNHVKLIIGAGLGGALLLVMAVAAIRSAYLEQNDIPAMLLPFGALQLGLFAVATVISIFSAHPAGGRYQQLERQFNRAVRRFHRLYNRAAHRAAQVNSLVAAHHGTVMAARGGVEASTADTKRVAFLHARGIFGRLPEPTTDRILDGDLPPIELPSSAVELLAYPAVEADSSLIMPARVSCEDLELRWEALQSGPVAPPTEPHMHVVRDDEEKDA
ncbi:hypothetical protein [Streptomyces sp. NPDC003401]